MKKRTNKIKNRKRRWKRKWNLFLKNLKKAVLVTAAFFIVIFIILACIPGNFMPNTMNDRDWSKKIVRLDMFEPVIDRIQDIVHEIQNVAEDIADSLKAMEQTLQSDDETSIQLDTIPAFENEPYVVINNNVPDFKLEEITTESYEYYSELDLLGRCGVTMACIGKDLMPTEERGAIGMVKPSGWKLKKYDIVDGKYIYNRCHLIGFQLTGENANVKNLITGTRYMNVDGMLPFENQVAEYIRKTGNHVMYRVTPIFEGNNLVASGVQMEAYSVEDKGKGVSFHVYIYNAQPGIEIDYETGDNWLKE